MEIDKKLVEKEKENPEKCKLSKMDKILKTAPWVAALGLTAMQVAEASGDPSLYRVSEQLGNLSAGVRNYILGSEQNTREMEVLGFSSQALGLFNIFGGQVQLLIDKIKKKKLSEKLLFGVYRHPIYTGLKFLSAGITIANPTLEDMALTSAIFYSTNKAGKNEIEELEDKYGKGMRDNTLFVDGYRDVKSQLKEIGQFIKGYFSARKSLKTPRH